MNLPQPQVSQNYRAFLYPWITRLSDFASFLQLVICNHWLAQLTVVVQVCILCSEPQLCGTVLRAYIY